MQDAIREEGLKRLTAGAIMAVGTCLRIASDPTAEHKDQLKAAAMIMNRVGLHETTEHKVAVTHKDQTSDEMIKRIQHLAAQFGMDAKKLIGSAAIDAEYVEVKEFDENSIEDML